MKLFRLKPITPSSRNTRLFEKSSLIKNDKIFKSLRKCIKRAYGRNLTTGRITIWHRKRGAKYLYRPLAPANRKKATITIGVSYDPNRNAFIKKCFDLSQQTFCNELASELVSPGTILPTSFKTTHFRGDGRVQIHNLPTGAIISNLSHGTASYTRYCKAAGTAAVVENKEKKHAIVMLPSGKKKHIPLLGFATVGVMSNRVAKLCKLGKAGRNVWHGRRPIVRGIAMNPVDHPHGGRTNGGRPSVTPWGLPTKGKYKRQKRRYLATKLAKPFKTKNKENISSVTKK